MIEYEVPDREGGGTGELDRADHDDHRSAGGPGGAYLRRRTTKDGSMRPGNRQLKTYLRGPGKVLRSQKPDMVQQEIYGYLLTHYAISALHPPGRHSGRGGPGPDSKSKRTVRVIRRRAADPGFSPLSSGNAP